MADVEEKEENSKDAIHAYQKAPEVFTGVGYFVTDPKLSRHQDVFFENRYFGMI